VDAGGKDPTRAARGPGARHDRLVLDALRHAEKPLGAYGLLGLLGGAGLRSPLQVYRALDRLIARGTVHKIVSVGAYAACDGEACNEAGHAVFAVCSQCGRADELRAPALDGLLRRLARKRRFRVEAATLELSGLCETCADG